MFAKTLTINENSKHEVPSDN